MIHKARWVSEAEFRFGGSATGLRGKNCVLQPPTIFPEWPDEASDQGGTSVSPTAHTSHPAKSDYAHRHLHRSTEGKKAKGTPHKMSVVLKKAFFLLVSTSLENPQQHPGRHESIVNHHRKTIKNIHSRNKGNFKQQWRNPSLLQFPLVPFFSLFLFFFLFLSLIELDTSSLQKLLIFQKRKNAIAGRI